jgi:hypothetical protein
MVVSYLIIQVIVAAIVGKIFAGRMEAPSTPAAAPG